MTQFDKSFETFPIKKNYAFINSCGVSPQFMPGAEGAAEFMKSQSLKAGLVFQDFPDVSLRLRRAAAHLLRVSAENISFIKNCAEGLSIIANGYPFEPGDEVLSYTHEYPSNHYPWLLQKKRGVKLVLLKDFDPIGSLPADRPRGISISELERSINPRTKIIAVSQVQFCSGFSLDLPKVSQLCQQHGIDLVLDVAQSLGALPVHPEALGISAVVSSGWKWLMGPLGTGILYTSSKFRSKIEITMAGPDMMAQGDDYLNYQWQPVTDGRKFEYSTNHYALMYALTLALEKIFGRYSIEQIFGEILRLQDYFINNLKNPLIRPVLFDAVNRSGILALICKTDPQQVMHKLINRGVLCSVRGGYLRFAPHFYATENEIDQLLIQLEQVAKECK